MTQAFYKSVMRETLQLGHFTDSNACSVGGMMGALIGLMNIPSENIDKIFKYYNEVGSDQKKLRPNWLRIDKQFLQNLQKLLKIRPKEFVLE